MILVKEVKPLRFNNADKFAAKVETDVNIIGNAAVESIKAIEGNKLHQAIFHLTNIVDLARDTRSEANLKRLEIRDNASARLIKRHIEGMTIVSPAMQEVIKEEKNQGFKRQNYYYKNRNFRRNSFSGFPHGFDSSIFQLAQAIQKLSNNNQFFHNGGRDSLQSRSNYQHTYPGKRKQTWLLWKQKILGRIRLQRGEEKILRGGRLSILVKRWQSIDGYNLVKMGIMPIYMN
jgi:hypothetical protein